MNSFTNFFFFILESMSHNLRKRVFDRVNVFLQLLITACRYKEQKINL